MHVSLRMRKGSRLPSSSVQGNNVDEAKTISVIEAAVKAGQASVDVDQAGCYYQVNVREDSRGTESPLRYHEPVQERDH